MTSLTKVFFGFIQLPRQRMGHYLKLGHEHFPLILSNSLFTIIISLHSPSYWQHLYTSSPKSISLSVCPTLFLSNDALYTRLIKDKMFALQQQPWENDSFAITWTGPSPIRLISLLLPQYETHYRHDNNGHVNCTCSTVTAVMRGWDHDEIEHINLVIFCGDYGNKAAMKYHYFSQFALWMCV